MSFINKIFSTLLFYASCSSYNCNCFDLEFQNFCNLYFKVFIFRKLLELFERNFFICWNCNICHDACILFEICYLMSGRFASIFLSTLIVKSLRIVTSVFSVTGCGVSPYHFSVWGSLKFLHNILCMKLATRSCLWRYSVLNNCWAS